MARRYVFDDDKKIEVGYGSAYQRTLTIQDSAGDAVDCSNWTACAFRVKKSPNDTDANALIEVAVDLDDSDHDLAAGSVVLKLAATDTAVEPGLWFWDLRIVRSSGTSPVILPSPPQRFTVNEAVNQGAIS